MFALFFALVGFFSGGNGVYCYIRLNIIRLSVILHVNRKQV